MRLELLQAFCIGLGLEPGPLHHLFEGGIGFMRLNYYAPLALSQLNLKSLAAMKRRWAFTPTAMPVFSHAGSRCGRGAGDAQGWEWHSVQPVAGAFTINVGDMCQVLSNDTVKAPVHRVVAPASQRRYSAPFFFNPAAGADIAPLPCFTAHTPAVYRPINWGKF